MTHITTSSMCLMRSFALLCFVTVQTGCRTPHPVNGPPESAGNNNGISDRTDDEMRPDRVFSECVKLKSAGSYKMIEGTANKEVTFYLDRDSKAASIRKLQKLMASFEFTLTEKSPHVAMDPEPDTSALWVNISPNGRADLLFILNGTSIITSDKVMDWHWSGGSSVMFSHVVEALAPNATERNVEPVRAAPEAEGDAR
jgi:hypothetical protein